MATTDKFELSIRMDATVTMFDATGQAINWLKPGSTVGHTWKGMPTVEEVILRYNDMKEVAATTLEDMIVLTQQGIEKNKHGG